MRVDVAIVGAGFAGLGMALALRDAGHESFVLLERAAGVGGTWRENVYPGVACDVPAHLYGFENRPNPDWSGLYARGDEIQGYLGSVAAEFSQQIRTHAPLLRAAWDGAAWQLDVGGRHSGRIEARALVVACGRLTEPKVPDIAGLQSFPGPMFHSARWDHTVPLDGARVAVVGTGASAVQLVPALAARGAAVTLFQRTPAWIVPRGARRYTDAEREAFAADPTALESLRAALYDEGEARYASRSGDAEAAASAREVALAHLAAQVADPALRAALTPAYAFGCKRVLLSDDFYPTLASGAVTLEPSALHAVEGSTLIAASGARHDADVLVLATGFEAAQQPYAQLIEGDGGVTLAEHWGRGMTSYASTLVSGFPHLYVLNGPNASLGHNSAVLMMEAQARFVARCLGTRGTIAVSPELEAAYSAEIDARAATTPWIAGGCRNWYVDERSGRLTLLWPGTVTEFRALLDGIDPADLVAVPAAEGIA